VLVGVYVVAVLTMMDRTTYDLWGGLTLAPVLILLSIPALRRQALREGDTGVFWLLLIALVVKLLGGVVRYALAGILYDNRGDAFGYHQDAIGVVESIASGTLDSEILSTGEGVISFVAGIVYTVLRPSVLVGFLIFSWLAFWGLFCFYRAFQIAVPEGRTRTYAKLLFFLPSVLFWPSSIGKEAWMMFVLGLASLGVAHLMTGRFPRAIVLGGAGLLGAMVVRPHFAGIVGVALTIGYVVRKPSASLRQLAPIVKLITLAGVVVVAAFFLEQTEQFLEQSGITLDQGLASVDSVSSAVEEAGERSEQGGSEFRATGLGDPLAAATSIGTVLFRPLPFEAGNGQAMMAAVESSALLALVVLRFGWVMAALRSLRRQPYVAYASAFAIGAVLALSAVANFGILARQRTLALPALMVLLSIPPRGSRLAPHREPEG
jgi:hypothetical protein